MMKIAVVVLAAGSGSRFGNSANKVWLSLAGRSIISRSLSNAVKSFPNCRVVLVVNSADEAIAKDILLRENPDLKVELVRGGDSRHESEYRALMYLAPEIKDGNINVVVIHDGARPLATSKLFNEVATAALVHGGALPGIAVDPREMDITSDQKIARVQTPQAFRAKELLSAYEQAQSAKFLGTDTAACMEKYFPNIDCLVVEGEVQNIKITYPQDLIIAEHLLELSLTTNGS
jgi:2-C-methyl-D-erythritol 4-phosphate cytidylyltransferase